MPQTVEVLDAIVPQLVRLDAIFEASSEEEVSHAIYWVKGDTGPDYEFNVKERNGTIIAITGSTPRFLIRRKGRTAVLISRVLTITDGPNGKCKFVLDQAGADWAVGKMDDAKAEYEGRLQITFPGGMVVSDFDVFPIVLTS